MNLESKTCLVIDNGLFFHFAEVLSRKGGFGKVLYYTPWQKAFPKTNDQLPGTGFDRVERVNERFEHFDEADVLVYPDVGYGGEQAYWRAKGKPVWGAGYGEALELDRVSFKKLLKKLSMPVGDYVVVHGVQALREYLKNHEDVWVKLSAMRGDAETFNAKNLDLVEPLLKELEVRLGPRARNQEFVVEKKLDAKLEIGFDGYNVKGKFASTGIMGVEVKDAAYLGVVKPYIALPSFIREANTKLSPVFSRYDYRGLFSSEIRVTEDKTAYFIDPCCRAGSPPSEVYVEAYSNWPEIVWGGAHGELVEPKPVAKYLAELMIESSWAESHWQSVEVNSEAKPFVKWKYPCVIDGVTYIIPNDQKVSLIGAVVGIGDTIKDAIKRCLDNRAAIKGYGLHSEDSALEEAVKVIEGAKALGVMF